MIWEAWGLSTLTGTTIQTFTWTYRRNAHRISVRIIDFRPHIWNRPRWISTNSDWDSNPKNIFNLFRPRTVFKAGLDKWLQFLNSCLVPICISNKFTNMLPTVGGGKKKSLSNWVSGRVISRVYVLKETNKWPVFHITLKWQHYTQYSSKVAKNPRVLVGNT